MKPISKKFLIEIAVFLIMAVIAGLYFYAVPAMIDVEKFKPEIKTYIQENFTVPVELGKLDIDTTWNLAVEIKADKASIKKTDGSRFVDAKNISVQVDILPLIAKNVNIREIKLDSLTGHITLLEDGSLDIQHILKKKKKRRFKVKLSDANIVLNNYNLSFTDNYISKGKTVRLKGEQANITKLSPGKYIQVQAIGTLQDLKKRISGYDVYFSSEFPFNKKYPTKNKIRAKGRINSFDLAALRPYVNAFAPVKFDVLQGKGNANFDIDLNTEIPRRRRFFIDSQVFDLNVIDSIRGKIMSHNGELSLYTAGNFDDKDLYLNDFILKGRNINASIRGKVSNFSDRKIRNSYLRIDIDKTRAKEAAEIFPKYIKVPLEPFRKILKHNIDAVISGSITTKGYYKKPDLFGSIKFDDLSILQETKGVPNGSGVLEFFGTNFDLNAKYYFTKDKFLKAAGNITPFKGKKLKLNITTSEDIDFAKALPVLFVIRDIFQFKLYPVTDMDIKGPGKVNMTIDGAFKMPSIYGYVEANGASVKFKTLASPAENVQGKVKFTGETVVYDELTATVEGMKIVPSGYTKFKDAYSDVKLYMPALDLKKGQNFIYGSPLLVEVQEALKEVQDIRGIADITVYLKGREKEVVSNGVVKVDDAYVKYNGYGEPFSKLKGQLRYTPEYLYFDNVSGEVLDNPVFVKGSVGVLNEILNLDISSKNMRLSDAKKFVMASPLLVKAQKTLKDFNSISGNAAVNMQLRGYAEGDPLKLLTFNDIDASFEHVLVGQQVNVSDGTLNITTDMVSTPGIYAEIANTRVFLKGNVSNLKANSLYNSPLIPDLEARIKRFDGRNLRQLLKIPVIPAKTKIMMSKLYSPNGFVDIVAKINRSSTSAVLDFNNFAAVYKPLDLPLEIVRGRANITNNSVYFSNLRGKMACSDFYINGYIKNFRTKPSFQLISSLDLNTSDLTKLNAALKQNFDVVGIIPVSANISGNIDNWKLLAKVTLNKGVSLPYANQIGLTDDKIRVLTLNAQGKKDRLDINGLKLDLYGSEDAEVASTPWQFNLLGQKENVLRLSGSIDKLATGKPEFKNLRIATSQGKTISTCVLNPCARAVINNGNKRFFSEGAIKADLWLNGPVISPDIRGTVTLSGLKVPDYSLNVESMNLRFNNNAVNIDVNKLSIDDSITNIKAIADYSTGLPILIKNLEINSDYINADKIGKIISSNKAITQQSYGDIKVPFAVIESGKLHSKELILRDLITSDASANITFTSDWLLSVSDINLTAAGGEATGNLYYNVKTTELSMNLDAANMQANAIASTFFSFPNEFYGTLNGESQFYTKGSNAEEMMSNANGYSSFKITDGRLVRLGSLEYLLRAANVLQSGVGGLNVNNIIDLIVPQKTGYFDELDGRFDIKDGVITTDGITSTGKNLSLFISGSFDMLTNEANIRILGSLSKKVSGMLGPIGSVSINQFIGYIPGFGFMPTAPEEKGLIDMIPGLSKIPVLGLDGKQKYRRFVVEIIGNVYDPKSVKSFRWID
jgi:hypothetical protein